MTNFTQWLSVTCLNVFWHLIRCFANWAPDWVCVAPVCVAGSPEWAPAWVSLTNVRVSGSKGAWSICLDVWVFRPPFVGCHGVWDTCPSFTIMLLISIRAVPLKILRGHNGMGSLPLKYFYFFVSIPPPPPQDVKGKIAFLVKGGGVA